MKKTIIAFSCFIFLVFIGQAQAHSLGARGTVQCHSHWPTPMLLTIETSVSYCSEYEAERALYQKALSICSYRGVKSFTLTHFLYYDW